MEEDDRMDAARESPEPSAEAPPAHVPPPAAEAEYRHADFIDLDDRDVTEVWTRKFAITAAQLEEAVRAVGNAAGDVYDYLQRPRH